MAVVTRYGRVRLHGRLIGLHLGKVEDRQADDELATPAQALAQGLDASSMHLHQAANQGQTQPQASLRVVERVIDLREKVEDSRQHLGRNADAVIADPENDVGPFARGRQADLSAGLVYLAALFSRLERT